VLLLSAILNNCGFPEYDFHSDGTAGNAAVGGNGPGGGVNGGSSGDAGSAEPAAGAPVGGGSAGEAGAAGAGCVYREPLIYPAHCFDHTLGDGETGVDCGGGQCSACASAESCGSDADCLSGKCTAESTCVQVFGVQYASIVGDALVRAPKFKLTLDYLDPVSTTLDQLRIRYYFNHNGVTEPVLGLDSQATIDPGGSQLDISAKVQAQVFRTLLGPAAPNNGRKTDSFLEIGFNSFATISSGTRLEITQDIVASSTDALFEQPSHYSFLNGAAANETITIYREGTRIWGIEPPLSELPACAYVAAVNLNGGALELPNDSVAAESEQPITFDGGSVYANAAAKVLPATDPATTMLLSSARTFSGSASATWAVPNGKYWAFAWLTSAASSDSGILSIQDNPTDKFYGLQKDSAAAWALLGPYLVSVRDEKLTLSAASGIVHVAGLKLYLAQ
jgi:hypothetical protein